MHVGQVNWRFPLLRFRSALHCGYSGITDIQDALRRISSPRTKLLAARSFVRGLEIRL
jgi:hypothetical protein